MNSKIVMRLVSRRYLAPTVTVILLTSGAMTYILTQYKELRNEQERFNTAQKTFFEDKAAFEKYKTINAIELAERKSEIEKREFIVGQIETQNTEQRVDIQKKTNEILRTQAALGDAQRKKESEDRLQKLMSDFSAMGVNLNGSISCDDAGAQAKFDAAKSKYFEAYSIAEAYGLTKRFETFFFHNGPWIIHPCSKKTDESKRSQENSAKR